ncbi:MAG: PEP-CTERM sorting domain-containing protein, partial [Chthoniobacterales bacterium]
ALFAVTTAQNVKAASYTFDPTVSGSQVWSTVTNWGTPGSASPINGDQATIDRSTSTSDLNLTTPTLAALSLRTLTLTAGSSSVLTLKLGNNLSLTNLTQSVFTNNISASQLVFDLNSYTFATDGGANGPFVRNNAPGLKYFTVKDTSAGGAGTINFGLYQQSSGNVSVLNNTTLRVSNTAGPGGVFSGYTTFSTGSTFQIDTNTPSTQVWQSTVTGGTNTGYGNVTIGSTTDSSRVTSVWFRGDSTHLNLTINGNFLIAQGSNIVLGNLAGQDITGVSVKGNFTDQGSAITTYQAAGSSTTFSLNGGIGTEHTLSINRTLNTTGGKTTSFQIGDGTTAGNIKLINAASNTVTALTTTGSVKVFGDSRLNLGTSTNTNAASLVAASINIVSGATIADTFGAHAGFASTSGVLTLNTFNLELNYDGTGWLNGSDLLLFHFASLTGTPTLGTVTANGISYGGLYNDQAGNIYLSRVSVVPEPSSVALLLGSVGGFLVWTVRRRRNS